MSMNPRVKPHLSLIQGTGTQADVAKEVPPIAQTRIRLATIFIDPTRRQRYIREEIHNFWRQAEVAIQQLLKTNTDTSDNDSLLHFMQSIRKAFMASYELITTPQLEELLDKVSILAYHCLRQLRTQTRDLKPNGYDTAFTSTDFYQYDPSSSQQALKPIDKLSVTIKHKDFELDTSIFEKELAEACISIIHYRLRMLAPDTPDSTFERYLLSVFTALNQRKHL